MPLIKRYSNRKLYDTDSKRYVTLEEVAEFIRKGEDVKVVDHATGDDLTSVTLFQVIFEEEKKIGGLIPQLFLSRLIRTSGDKMSALRSRLLSIDPFQVVDEEIRRRLQSLVDQNRIGDEEAAHIQDLLVRKPVKKQEPVRIQVVGEEDEQITPGSDSATKSEDLIDPARVEALQKQVELLEQELARLVQMREAAIDQSPDPNA